MMWSSSQPAAAREGRASHERLIAPSPEAPAPDARHDLLSTLENQVIPRLLLAHATVQDDLADALVECAAAHVPPTREEIEKLADLAVAQDVTRVLGCVEAMLRAGLSLESLLLDLVTPAARLLGDRWLADRIGFADVTLGLGTLQRLVTALASDLEPGPGHRGLVALAPIPGEQHTLAVQVLGELLRQSGWGVHTSAHASESELLDLVASDRFVMVGLSVSNTGLVKSLGRLVTELKKHSLNPDIMVMVGGAVDLTDSAARAGAVYCPSAADALGRLAAHAPG